VTRRALVGCEFSGLVREALAGTGYWDEVWSSDLLPTEILPDCVSAPGQQPAFNGRTHPEGRVFTGHYQGDVRDLFDWDHPVNARRKRERDLAGILRDNPVPLWTLFIGHPPCTHLAQAGAVWWKHKDATRGGDGRMQEGAAFFMKMVNAPARHVAVENPVGVMGLPSQACYYRRPDQVVQPHMFGDPLIKATCLWIKDLPSLVADNPVEPEGRVASGGGSCRTDIAAGRGMKFVNGHEDRRGRKLRQQERNRTLPGFARAMATQWTAFIRAQEEGSFSDCCGAPGRAAGNVTRYYVCTSCEQACDMRAS
jgi:hypothetical protein